MPQINWPKLVRASTVVSLLMYGVAGAIGALGTIVWGPPLAMGAAIYLGNTEPTMPVPDYPVFWAITAMGLAGAGLLAERTGRVIPGAIVAHVGGVLFAVLPLVHIVRMWSRT